MPRRCWTLLPSPRVGSEPVCRTTPEPAKVTRSLPSRRLRRSLTRRGRTQEQRRVWMRERRTMTPTRASTYPRWTVALLSPHAPILRPVNSPARSRSAPRVRLRAAAPPQGSRSGKLPVRRRSTVRRGWAASVPLGPDVACRFAAVSDRIRVPPTFTARSGPCTATDWETRRARGCPCVIARNGAASVSPWTARTGVVSVVQRRPARWCAPMARRPVWPCPRTPAELELRVPAIGATIALKLRRRAPASKPATSMNRTPIRAAPVYVRRRRCCRPVGGLALAPRLIK
jgi:hypothetical protein